jgi:hypothetical protein
MKMFKKSFTPDAASKDANLEIRSKKDQPRTIVPAFVISKPDLFLNTTIQNLLSYCLNCLNEISKENSSRQVLCNNFEKCLEKLESLGIRIRSELSLELRKLLDELIEEGHHTVNITRTFADNVSTGNQTTPAELLLIAKSTRLQWLVVCLQEELRK